MNFKTCAKFAGTMLATSALVAVTSIAMANGQGTPIEAPPPAPAPEPMMAPAPTPINEVAPMTWQGGYIGGFVGYGFQPKHGDETLGFDTNLDGNFDDTVKTAAGADAFSPGFCNGSPNTNAAAGGCEKDDRGGFEGGIRAGYDWQSGNFVYGGLLEASIPDVSDSVTGFSTTPAAYEFNREVNYLAAARLRAGAVLGDSFLLYATGGVAYGDVDHTFRTTNTANSFNDQDTDSGLWGYQLGAGVETMVAPNFTVGLEYIYTSLDDGDYHVAVGKGTAPATNPFLLANAAGTDIQRDEDRFDIHSVRLTAAYRFGGM